MATSLRTCHGFQGKSSVFNLCIIFLVLRFL
jgi:hypothetical protein